MIYHLFLSILLQSGSTPGFADSHEQSWCWCVISTVHVFSFTSSLSSLLSHPTLYTHTLPLLSLSLTHTLSWSVLRQLKTKAKLLLSKVINNISTRAILHQTEFTCCSQHVSNILSTWFTHLLYCCNNNVYQKIMLSLPGTGQLTMV